MDDTVRISVHRRLDQPGFVVKVASGDDLRKFVTTTKEEAMALAEAIKGCVEVGLPIDALLGGNATAVEVH